MIVSVAIIYESVHHWSTYIFFTIERLIQLFDDAAF